ncbi:hypothetical protein [Candidatus Accumulibacter vicinus]|jgi:hypothetical protein|uniref:hypothetical protein n=1 Tax=Candidatus Accumulibacter vicinus TaxID=2954382 RepID=UPI00235B6DED|nr:hypothetical protein [Candidatus Accumulibacter vicinus]
MKTIVFGGTKEQEGLYRIANCLFEVVETGELTDCDVHLVGTYKKNPKWSQFREQIRKAILNPSSNVSIYIKEWNYG